MKTIATLLAVMATLWACNNQSYSGHEHHGDSTATNQPQQEKKAETLELNNGAKWDADESTGANVEALFAIIDAFNQKEATPLPAYKKAAEDFQKALDKMIAECKMEGPEHDALHLWLHPLLEQVSKLKQAPTEAEAAELYDGIVTQVSLYPQYFE